MKVRPFDLRLLRVCEPQQTRFLLRFVCFGLPLVIGAILLSLLVLPRPLLLATAIGLPVCYVVVLAGLFLSLLGSVSQQVSKLERIVAGLPESEEVAPGNPEEVFQPSATQRLERTWTSLGEFRAHYITRRRAIVGVTVPFLLLVGVVIAMNVPSRKPASQPPAAPIVLAETPTPEPTQPPPTPAPVATRAPTAVPTRERAPSDPLPTAPPGPLPEGTYVVKAGDTLTSLAAGWGVSVAAIVELNGIATPSLIHTGVLLYIPNR